jgi:hypothetical protein
VEKMSESMSGKNISPDEKFPALCGKGCTVFHTNQVTQKNLYVRQKNLCAPRKNLYVTQKNLYALRKNLYVRQKNLCAPRKNLYVTQKNLCALRKNLYVTQKNLCALRKNLYVTQKNLCVPRKNLCAHRINPRAAFIYRGFVYRKPNVSTLICLKIFTTNKAAAYSHVSTAGLNKAWLMIVKVPVNPCKRVNLRQK